MHAKGQREQRGQKINLKNKNSIISSVGSAESAGNRKTSASSAKMICENSLLMSRATKDGESTGNQGPTPFAQTYFHGTRANLKVGELIEPGYNSNYGERKKAKYIFLSATLDAAIWGAELAFGDGAERIYLVEPLGKIEDDPDLTNQRFPGNPSKSYRSAEPFRVVGEVTGWQGHPEEQVRAMKEGIAKLQQEGKRSLNEE